ncbi:hypothetical protein [Stappia sp. MMSF_3263]|uniref:hypothetical protein n=1 Tax=Stappia sp. MMSF_3263 TaxID=3046693 RepID=UPI00273E8523|nr:hypothetical protein [Stappia sp. MMSF_3263]
MIRFMLGVISLALLFPTGPTAADPVLTETRPIDGDPLRDFRISDCIGTFGMASYHYYTREKGRTLVLSDLCLDEENGILLSAEEKAGFQLVSNSDSGRKFEILGSGKNEYDRYNIVLSSEDGSACPYEASKSYWYHYFLGRGSSSRFPDQDLHFAQGYTIDDTSDAVKVTSGSSTHEVSFIPLSIDGRDLDWANAGGPHLASFMASGKISWSNDQGQLVLVEGDGNKAGEVEGELDITGQGNGEVMLNGKLAATNARLAGHSPKEWVSMEANIPYMRGHILGDKGTALYASGLAVGTYVDASGEKHSFRGNLHLYGCFR